MLSLCSSSVAVRFSLGHIIEQAANGPVTPDSVIQAVRVFAHLAPDSRRVNPPKQLIIDRVPQYSERSAATEGPLSGSCSESPFPNFLNRQSLSSDSTCNSLKTNHRAPF